ncbi:short-chain dehydrogenase, partial [Streptomyces sp. DJ]
MTAPDGNGSADHEENSTMTDPIPAGTAGAVIAVAGAAGPAGGD